MITILFSKDRATQCDLALNTLDKNCIGNVNPHVLYTCSNENHEKSYEILKKEHSNISFHRETNFQNDLLELIKYQDYIMFLVDDNIFTNNFNINKITKLLHNYPELIGFSLRLGVNSTYCYSLNCEQEIPPCTKPYKDMLMFGWVGADSDFGYPLELSSSIYPISSVSSVLYNTKYDNPNQLEWIMSQCLSMLTTTKPLLASYEQSVSFCNPINKVQNVNNNRFSKKAEYSSDLLLTNYLNGGRIITSPFEGFISNSCHQEVDIFIDYKEKYD